MNIKAIKGCKHDFNDHIGPSEIRTVGLEIDGKYHELGKFYFGPYMGNETNEIFEKYEQFVDTCEKLFAMEEQ